jgi:hypothetical protein
LDTPICRIRQIIAAIEYRRNLQFRQQAGLTEWSTKRSIEFVAATVRPAKGQRNPLLEQAQKISLHLDDDGDDSSQENVVPSDERSVEDIMENGSEVAEKLNKPGSFESLMQGFRA